ncbi:hypothetical protein DITRI_Ditri02bG0091000 [Diplodiscus trichospermus]
MNVHGAKAIVPIVIKTVEIARQHGIFVVWVVREHDYRGRDVEHCCRHLYCPLRGGLTIKRTFGAKLVDGLVIQEGDYKLSNGINNLVVVGVPTPTSIRQTVFDAVAYNYQSVTVIFDATAAASADIHGANIFDMTNVGVLTPTLQQWCHVIADRSTNS